MESTGRKGTRVTGLPDGPGRPRATASPPAWERLLSAAGKRVPAPLLPGLVLPWWDEEAAAALRRCLDHVLGKRGALLLVEGPPEGYRPLREWLAKSARQGGSGVGPEEILIVNGHRQAMHLVCRALLNPGDLVLAQEPTNPAALVAFRKARAKVVGVAVSPTGLDLDSLDEQLGKGGPKLLYLMPSFHEPTGVTMDLATRLAVLERARHHGFLILEDVRSDELIYRGHLIPPLKANDCSGHVVQVSTTLRSLLPGLGLGWVVAAPPAVRVMARIKHSEDAGPGALLQAGLHEFCRQGHCERHFERARRAHRILLGALTRALAQHLPPSAAWSVNPASLAAWIELPEGLRARDLVRRAAARRAVLEPGDAFFASGGGARHLRFTWPHDSPAGLEAEVKAIAELLGALSHRAARPG